MLRTVLGNGLVAIALLGACALQGDELDVGQTQQRALVLPAPNAHGIADSISTMGDINELMGTNPFFDTTLGTNGRSCLHCHDPSAGWTISAEQVQEDFDATDGLGALFASLHDNGNRPDADLSTLQARKKAFSSTLKLAVTRFPTVVSPDAEFEVIDVKDPYGWSTVEVFSRFRRPVTIAQESQQASITWTGGPHDVPALLEVLMGGAVAFHAQGVDPVSAEDAVAGAEFMLSVFNAQAVDNDAGPLDADGARGGPVHLSQQEFFVGINSGADFDRKVFDIYDAWLGADEGPNPTDQDKARASIARGQEIFNFREFASGGTCSGCHNAPNVGSSSTFRMFNIGSARDKSKDLPVVTVRNKATGEIIKTTDLGRALVTGLWDDIGRFKANQIRGLASRAPYFHNGSARTIKQLVKHYDKRFDIKLKGHEKRDLEAFLLAL